jgi:putative flippase GtrA
LTYKFFVFKTKGKWLAEYLKCYLVYGMAAVLSLFLVWGLVDGLDIPFWLAQGLVMILSVAFSYFGHSRFSFADRSKATEKNLEVQADDQK